MNALDTAQTTTSKLACLAAAGVEAVGRYYSKSGWKRLTNAEARALSDAGIAIWVVYQDANNSYGAFTATRGRDHAGRAVQQARGIGQPAGSAIYFAVDYDASPREAAGRIADYFAAIRATFAAAGSPYRIGVYGNGTVCAAMLDGKLADLAWLSMSTGHHGHRAFAQSRRWALRQRLETRLCGLPCDPNDLRDSVNIMNFGGFRLPPIARPRLTVKASRLNLRAAPNGRILATLPRGTQVEIIGPSTGARWRRVRAGAVEGHVFAAYLTAATG